MRVPEEDPPAYEEAVTSVDEQENAALLSDQQQGSGRVGRHSADRSATANGSGDDEDGARRSFDRLYDSDGNDDIDRLADMDVDEAHRDMEQFDIDDPGASSSSVYNRASSASQRFARSINSKIFSPVRNFVIDPVARFWTVTSQRFDGLLSRFGNPLMFKRLLYLLAVALLIFAAVTTGIVPTGVDDPLFAGPFHNRAALKQFLRDAIDREYLKGQFDYLTSMSHMAGSAGDLTLARYVESEFRSFGLQPVEVSQSDAYMTYPNETNSAMELKLLDSDGAASFEAVLWEDKVYDHIRDSQKPTRPYHALSPGGSAKGHMVYANYGSKQDFEKLKDLGIDLKDAIVFVQNGKMEPGLKVMLAEEAGASAVVFFSYPAGKDQAWPKGPALPDGGVERGSVGVAALTPGDLLTPGWSSARHPQVIDLELAKNVPKIPSIPISWKNAEPFINAIKSSGKKVDEWTHDGQEAWTGGKDGPQVSLNSDPVVRDRHAIWNVLTKIDGVEQSDRAIIIGAQRDSFCYGGAGAMSGTSVLIELARVFADMSRRLGWRPLRSIYFASWDGSEQSLLGSTEWVEFNIEELRREGVVYINLQDAIAGHTFDATGHPIFDGVMKEILNDVAHPADNTTSLGEDWGDNKVAPYTSPGDYLPFLCSAGIVSLDVAFRGMDFPRHSCFDSNDWMKKFGDPEFEYHRALADVAAFLILKYADEPLIDFDVRGYAYRLEQAVKNVEQYAKEMDGYEEGKLNFNDLHNSVGHLMDSAVRFEEWSREWKDITRAGEPQVLMIHRMSWNIRLTELEKSFLDPNGLPNRNWFKNTIFGPQLWHPIDSKYDWFTFPGIRDLIEAKDWTKAQEHMNDIASRISATATKFTS